MKESFLHYIWFFKLVSKENLKTYNNEYLEILSVGKINKDSGPDFLESEIIVGNKVWIGSVEIHVNSSDWNRHNHSDDLAYKNVVLHVVWNHDCEIDILKKRNVSTLVLQQYVKPEVVFNYEKILNTNIDKIHCRDLLENIDLKQFSSWFGRLLIDRLEEKAGNLLVALKKNNSNWEETLFSSLSTNFGLSVNVDAFYLWSNSFSFKVLQKIQFDPIKVEALFFGQAGFLSGDYYEDYYNSLKKEYLFLKNKFQLAPVPNEIFRFSKMRPIGFPTIRIAQLASIYSLHKNLFSKILTIYDLIDFYKLFEDINLNLFWNNHYTFKSESRIISKKISKTKINNILINTIIPIRYAYDSSHGKNNIEFYVDLLEKINPEKNSILDEYESIGFSNKSAKSSQELLQLKKRYCKEKKCLSCAIGIKILR